MGAESGSERKNSANQNVKLEKEDFLVDALWGQLSVNSPNWAEQKQWARKPKTNLNWNRVCEYIKIYFHEEANSLNLKLAELYGSGIEWERDEEKGWFTLLKYDKPLSGSNAESTGPRCNEALKMNKGERELAS